MDEKRIQQVLCIEKHAQEIHDAAVADALNLPIQAEKEAHKVIEDARIKAEEEARKIMADAKAEEECAIIMAEAEAEILRTEAIAKSNIDRAISFVLNRVIGRE